VLEQMLFDVSEKLPFVRLVPTEIVTKMKSNCSFKESVVVRDVSFRATKKHRTTL